MTIYSTMLVFPMSEKAQIKAGKELNKNVPELPYDLRVKYPFYKLGVGQSLAFELDKFNEKSIRSTVSQFNKRHNCQLICLKHDAVLEVARLK